MLYYNLIKNITDYLETCNKCQKFQIKILTQKCFFCNKSFCFNCKLVSDITPYETTDLYCIECHQKYFREN